MSTEWVKDKEDDVLIIHDRSYKGKHIEALRVSEVGGVAKLTVKADAEFLGKADLDAATIVENATQVNIADAGSRYVGTNVETALQEALVKGDLSKVVAVVGTEGAVAADAIEVACTIKNMLNVAITTQPKVLIKATATTANKGHLAAAGTPIGTAGVLVNPATGSCYFQMTPTNTGTFSFRVTDDQVESVIVEITGEGIRPSVLVLTFA